MLWDEAVAFEWKKATEDEADNGQKYPYMLCHVGEGMSGYRRKVALAEALGYTEDDEELNSLRPLYNGDDYLCVYGQVMASAAMGVTGDEFIVQPLTQSMKFMNRFVENANEQVGNANLDETEIYIPTLDVVMCPGVAIDENITIDDISEYVIGTLTRKTIASKLAAAISDTYYLTSDAYGNSTLNDGDGTSERAQLWKSLIDDYQNSGVCEESYEKTKWVLTRANDLNTGLSHIEVEFNNTGKTEQDQACMLTLSLALASYPDVCAIEMREPVDINNHVATWLTQSELENKMPFFDAGLDGDGQVVTISDTGIDQNHCYFWDANEKAGAVSWDIMSKLI